MEHGERRCALVLSGGGALGAAHLGAVERLLEAGYHFDWFAGVSAGAIVGACLAAGLGPQEIWALLRQRKLLSLAFDFSSLNSGILRGEKVYRTLEETLGSRTFADLEAPLVIGATDFQTGERVLIREGKLVDAVRASLSVPVLFNPYFHPQLERWLVDGGITQNFPLDLAVSDYPGSAIIGIDVATSINTDADFQDSRRFQKTKTLMNLLNRTIRILLASQQKALPADPRAQVIRPNLAEFSALDIFTIDTIRERGRLAADAWVAR